MRRAQRDVRVVDLLVRDGLRVDQHLDLGQGELDWDLFFSTLHEVSFDGILTSCVFAWEERAVESSRFMREESQKYVDRYWT